MTPPLPPSYTKTHGQRDSRTDTQHNCMAKNTLLHACPSHGEQRPVETVVRKGARLCWRSPASAEWDRAARHPDHATVLQSRAQWISTQVQAKRRRKSWEIRAVPPDLDGHCTPRLSVAVRKLLSDRESDRPCHWRTESPSSHTPSISYAFPPPCGHFAQFVDTVHIPVYLCAVCRHYAHLVYNMHVLQALHRVQTRTGTVEEPKAGEIGPFTCLVCVLDR